MAQLAHFAASAMIGGAAARPDRRRVFTVSRDRRGRWIARELGGTIGGVFVDRRTAIRFALFEAHAFEGPQVEDPQCAAPQGAAPQGAAQRRRSAVIVIPDGESAEGAHDA